jgi:hypothetical protein
MKTNHVIDDDVFQAAEAKTKKEDRTVGQVVSEVLRIFLRPPARFPTFQVSADAAPLTPEMVRRALEE